MKNEMDIRNPLRCDPTEGICAVPDSINQTNIKQQKTEKKVKIIYFTDPICSSCWGIEPQLRKLRLEYGDDIEVDYRMGGLLPDWSYNSGGISKPSDVAHHWDEVSVYYDMPIDGDVWLEDPLDSSFPPSIAFKAAQMQDKEKALLFLRELREMVFLKKKNITKWENISEAAKKTGLDLNSLKTDYEGKARELFNDDLRLSRELGVRGFPTIFFTTSHGDKEIVYGSKPYSVFESAVHKTNPAVKKTTYSKEPEDLFKKYRSLTAKELSEISGKTRNESEQILNQLTEQGKIIKFTTKNGSMWTLKN
ncbi:MAG: DsbA family protein [Bacteroidia bacterium]|nr:DsbA family protein [Bacteroidia bacterium]